MQHAAGAFFPWRKANPVFSKYVISEITSKKLVYAMRQVVKYGSGKKSKGLLPIISTMPKDNHSLMQLYLDGPKNSFYTFFDVFEKKSSKINNSLVLNSHNYLKNKSFLDIRQHKRKLHRLFLKIKKYLLGLLMY